jgi:hypothetical protein
VTDRKTSRKELSDDSDQIPIINSPTRHLLQNRTARLFNVPKDTSNLFEISSENDDNSSFILESSDEIETNENEIIIDDTRLLDDSGTVPLSRFFNWAAD